MAAEVRLKLPRPQGVETLMKSGSLTILALLLLCSLSARGQDAQFVTATIPVVAHTGGAGGIQWMTDVALRNDLPFEVQIFLNLPNAYGEPFFSSSVAPGQTLYFGDIVRSTFGLPEAMSPLVISTMAPRSVTVGAIVYGWFQGRMTNPEYITPLYGTPGGGTQYLSGLALTQYYRTNIGLGNTGEDPATFVVAIQRIPGRNIAVTTVTVNGHGLLQGGITDFFPLLTQGDGFYLLVECNSSEGYAYASVIDNETQDAWYLH